MDSAVALGLSRGSPPMANAGGGAAGANAKAAEGSPTGAKSVESQSSDDRTLHAASSEDRDSREAKAVGVVTLASPLFSLPARPASETSSAQAAGSGGQKSAGRRSTPPERGAGPAMDAVGGTSGPGSDGAAAGSRDGAVQPSATSPSSQRTERRFGPYILHKTLGEGQFGKVKLASLAPGSPTVGGHLHAPTVGPSRHHVAIKLVRKDTIIKDPVRRTKLAREIALLRRVCQHPNIVTLEQVIETERYVGIVMEYAQGGELFDRILASKYLKPDEARWFFLQLLDGVQHLHQRGVVHRDLKLENLMVAWDESDGLGQNPRLGDSATGKRNPFGLARERIVITDFGFATTIITDLSAPPQPVIVAPAAQRPQAMGGGAAGPAGITPPTTPGTPPPILAAPPEIPHRLLQTSCGSPCYAAPELVLGDPEGKGYDGIKADLWSCGVILYAMCSGYLPFDGEF